MIMVIARVIVVNNFKLNDSSSHNVSGEAE
jgi:hypothetical protein